MSVDGSVEVCGGKELGAKYLLRLVHCMEKLFLDKHTVSPSLVADVDHYVFKQAGEGGEGRGWGGGSGVCLMCATLSGGPCID